MELSKMSKQHKRQACDELSTIFSEAIEKTRIVADKLRLVAGLDAEPRQAEDKEH